MVLCLYTFPLQALYQWPVTSSRAIGAIHTKRRYGIQCTLSSGLHNICSRRCSSKTSGMGLNGFLHSHSDIIIILPYVLILFTKQISILWSLEWSECDATRI